MQQSKEHNRQHWNAIGSAYEYVWKGHGKSMLSAQETSYIESVARMYHPQSALDVGCGTGRILDAYTRIPSIHTIYGIDTAEMMVEHSKKRFHDTPVVKEIIYGNIEDESVLQGKKFDMITAIRVLKYNRNWKEMISAMADRLSPHGILICTMPNIHSISALWPDTIQYTTPHTFVSTLENHGLRVLDMQGFTKLPDLLYTHAPSAVFSNALHTVESWIRSVVGPTAGTRILFVVCTKL